MIFEYFINLDERGEFNADVRNEAGETVFELQSDENGEVWLIDGGWMRHKDHIDGLAAHLMSIGIMAESDELIKGN